MRRAWADWLNSKDSIKFNWYNEKQLQEIKTSIIDFIDFVEKFIWYETKETKRFKEIIN